MKTEISRSPIRIESKGSDEVVKRNEAERNDQGQIAAEKDRTETTEIGKNRKNVTEREGLEEGEGNWNRTRVHDFVHHVKISAGTGFPRRLTSSFRRSRSRSRSRSRFWRSPPPPPWGLIRPKLNPEPELGPRAR